MKKALLLFTAISLAVVMHSADVKLVVQKVDNGGVVAGSTFRVYAQMPTTEHSLHIVYGDEAHPLKVESTAPFYQNQYGGHSAAGVSENVFASEPAMKFDSWITLGYANNVSNDMWDLGVDFSTFDNGGSIMATNGGWFLIPTDNKCQQDNSGLVLIAQFTTTGTATGTLNLQGWQGANNPWRAEGLTFSTSDFETFGCNDKLAANYNADATFNDGTCVFSSDINTAPRPAPFTPANAWDVFPNPLRENMINVQFNNIDVKEIQTRIDILDMTGKLVGSHQVSADAVIGGNRVVINQDLASGTYSVVLIQGDIQESKLIVVEK